MFATHLRLLIIKSLRYAYRQRICRCCPKAFFECFLPSICLLLLCLIRWIHTGTTQRNLSPHIVESIESKRLFNYTTSYQCPSANRTIYLINQTKFVRFQHLCPRSHLNFITSLSNVQGELIFNESRIEYRCRYDDRHWCEEIEHLSKDHWQHPSAFLCSSSSASFVEFWKPLIRNSLAFDSLIHRPSTKVRLTFFTWPCSTYLSDILFDESNVFTLVLILILIDFCILFSHHLLLNVLIEEKCQGTIELLRLLSIHPLVNSFAWFIRQYFLQLIVMIVLTIILKIPIGGQAFFPHVSFVYLLLSFLLWSIQTLSQSVLIGHLFTSQLKASICSWFIYLFSFWLSFDSRLALPMLVRQILSIVLPFYSIKRQILLFMRLNVDLGRNSTWKNELISLDFASIIGTILFWLVAIYVEPICSGHYGVKRSFFWPIEKFRRKKMHRDEPMIKTSSNECVTVRIENLTKSFTRDRHFAVDHLSFELEHSKICGFIGPNGSGKTTTIEMICGFINSDEGSIEIHGKNLYEHRTELQRTIGFCPQDDLLFAYLTVEEQLEFYGQLRCKDQIVDYRRQIDELLVLMDMKKFDKRLCQTLSGGMKRKLSILCAFVGQVDIILLDEPSASLDPVARQFLRSWLREQKLNRTILVSSHLLDEIEEIADSLLIIDAGRVCAQGSMAELKQRFIRTNDRLHLERMPSYVPSNWIVDIETHLVEVPNRKELIPLLEHLEHDQIRYTLKNPSLEEIFLQLTSNNDPSTNVVQFEKIFQTKTRSSTILSQIFAVFSRRFNIVRRHVRLLPLFILFYLFFNVLSRFVPSWSRSSSSINSFHYVISTRSEFVDRFSSKTFEKTFLRPFETSSEFQQEISQLPTRYSKNLIGFRVVSSDHVECYLPSPYVSNLIRSCLTMFSFYTNRSISPVEIISRRDQLARDSSSINAEHSSSSDDSLSFLCFYSLPPSLHSSIVLISLIFIVSAALTIEDFHSGLHDYSLIHGLRSWIHWLVIYLTDLIISLIWLFLLIIVELIFNSKHFYTNFYLFAPLFFVADLPMIYLLAKFVQNPLLGATAIYFLLQFVHFLYTFRIVFELFRTSPFFAYFLPIFRWTTIFLFPNVNLYTLIVAVLRPSTCPIDDHQFGFERYPMKIFLHSTIFFAQIFVYSTILIFLDRFRSTNVFKCLHRQTNQTNKEEDFDVFEERQRIRSMDRQNKENEALVVENLSKTFQRRSKPIVDRLTFAVSPGECFGLLGFNGSGKTTIFRMLVGQLRVSQGEIFRRTTSTIGYCPQDDISFSGLTISQTIDYISRLHGIDPSMLIDVLLEQFQLTSYRNHRISELSGGTRRRFHLALALIGAPSLLLLDEPTAKVDPLLRAQLRLLLQHRPKDVTIVFASHSMFECEQLCQRLTILVHGQAQCLGSPEHLKNRFGRKYRVRLEVLEQNSLDIPALMKVNDSIEYIYVNEKLSQLFSLLEEIVAERRIAPNYSVQLTSLEHVFLSLQYRLGRDN